MRPGPRRAGALLGAAAVLCSAQALAADFDPSTGALTIASDSLRAYRFESAQQVVDDGIHLAKWGLSDRGETILDTVPASLDALAPLIPPGSSVKALEGTGCLRITMPNGVAVVDEGLFGSLMGRRIEVAVFVRAEGGAPDLRVLYGRSSVNAALGFAQLYAIRTGRETSDGWVEYATGPIDGSVWGAPIRAIAVLGVPAAGQASKAWIDALEIRPAQGPTTPAAPCTQSDVDAACGPAGECLLGHCAPASVVWGPLPTRAHRDELAERWIQIAARFQGDRAAAVRGRSLFAANARALARDAVSSRQFFGGLTREVNLLRQRHTMFEAPPSWKTLLSPVVFDSGTSAALGACFGVIEKDLLGGGRGFAVFQAGASPKSGVELKVGDVLTTIDGKDPGEWLASVVPIVAPSLPGQPLGDDVWEAQWLSEILSLRARSLGVLRCGSSTSCAGPSRVELTVNLGQTLFAQATSSAGLRLNDGFACSPRLHPAVDAPTPHDPTDNVVDVQTKGDVTFVQFDGFQTGSVGGSTQWIGAMRAAFDGRPAKLVMDARVGFGGNGLLVGTLIDLARGRDDPLGFVSLPRGGWDEADPAGLFAAFEDCKGTGSLRCMAAWSYFTSAIAPPGAETRIAWLNTLDVSANDYAPRLLQGRTGVRIFGPSPTSGAFGALALLAPSLPGWSAGTFQSSDARFGPSRAALAGARWESSHGVTPDQVVTQTLSDLLRDRDTILEAARAWLAGSTP